MDQSREFGALENEQCVWGSADGGPILVVDDDDGFLFLVKQYYKKGDTENPLCCLSSGTECIKYMEEALEGSRMVPDTMYIDINMPLLNGFQTVEQIRAMDGCRECPKIFILSSSIDPEDSRRALVAGANGYLDKYSQMTNGNPFLHVYDEPQ